MHRYSHTRSIVNDSRDYWSHVIMKEVTPVKTENPNRTTHQHSNTANTKQNLPETLLCVLTALNVAGIRHNSRPHLPGSPSALNQLEMIS